ncbi:MAG: biotin transporter BioY [Caldibacillus sp.]
MSRLRAIEITMCSMFVVLIIIGANITSIFPFMVVGGVPITLQTFFVILAGLILGSKLGTISVLVYTLMGLLGLPVFAQFTGGLHSVFLPTFGFILSFIIAAYACGKIVEKFDSIIAHCVAALVGLVINYIIGTNWMYFAYMNWFKAPGDFSYKIAWLWMVPPLLKDLPLSVFAAFFAYRFKSSVIVKSQFKKMNLG